MHSEAEIRIASARAGCRVLELRRVETEFGPVWYGKHTCPSNAATFQFLLEIGKLDVADPLARSIALGLLKKNPKNPEALARSIHRWVKEHVLYVREPKETFQSPTYTVRSGAGDCDDHANLVHAIARNAGLDAAIVPLRKGTDVRHAVAQIKVNGRAVWVETTVDAAFGEDPRAAVRRLKVARGDIHGIDDEGIDGTSEIKGVRVLYHQGTTYRARVRVDAPSFLATTSAIASKFADEGFSNVTAWKDPSDLPADWPPDEKAVVSGFGQFTAFLEGSWLRPDEAKVSPPELLAVWVHKAPAGEHPPTMAPEGSHAWAREIVRLAWQAVFGETPSDGVAQTVQAIALHEAGYGFALKTPDGVPSHNWGSVQCASGWTAVDCLHGQTCPAGCFAHQDHNAQGVCYIGCFRQYAEPFLGARDFVRTLAGLPNRRAVRAALPYGNATEIAREMRASGYFEAPAATYAAAIGRRAREIATALREPVYVEPRNVVAALASLGLVAGGSVLWYRYTYDQCC